ncbi:tetratricopeptide repeat protein 23-like [Platysternon megacephalum]|uniref:Muscarinic acetylcholine receptor n=1 Tax=Platysternon megacephalum TaxID=55544 RepID=A0A4D9ELG2_9SAUR|nr:tetratricopeptide repeat protein 23-like [Platysternon megacephalum]
MSSQYAILGEVRLHPSTMNLSNVPPALNGSQGGPGPTLYGDHSLWQVVLIVLMTGILSLVTVVGNLLVMVSFKVNSELKTVNNYFLLSLACADLIIGAVSMNLYTTYIIMGHWALGNVACDLWLALDYVASNASVMNLLIISFDRYFSVTRPLTYRAKRTPKRAAIMIGLAWAISFILWAPAILFWQYFVGERTVPSGNCHLQFLSQPIITFGTAIAAFYLPVTIMIILYWRIYRETENRARELACLQGSESKSIVRPTPNNGPKGGGVGSNSSSEQLQPIKVSSAVAKAHTQACCFPSWKKARLYVEQSSNGSWINTEEEEEEDGSPDSLTSSEGEEQPFEVQSVCSVVIRLPMIGSVAQPPLPTQKPTRDQEKLAGGPWAGGNGLCRILAQSPAATESPNMAKKPSNKKISPMKEKGVLTAKSHLRKRSKQLSQRKTLSLIKEKKAARTLSAILLAFILTWTPYNIMVLVSTFCQDCVPNSLWKLGYWLCYVNSTVNPMCYALCNKSFRNTFKMLLLCRWDKRRWGKMPKHVVAFHRAPAH